MDYSNMSNEELEQLISQDDMDAACEMAGRHLYGDNAEPNLNRAYQLFHRAETHGNVKAYEGLGYMYENGILFAQNLELAKDYYARAGIYKADLAPEQVRLTQEQKVAAALARSQSPNTVVVSTGGPIPESDKGPIGSRTLSHSLHTPAPGESFSPTADTPASDNTHPMESNTASYATPAPEPAISAAPSGSGTAPEPPISAEPAGSGMAPGSAVYAAPTESDTATNARIAAEKAAEAAEAARIAAMKAQEAANAAELAAEYARKACQ